MDRKTKGTAAGIFMLAFLARLLPVFVFPSIHHPDEIFQTLEPAHRLIYGYGIVSWEWIYGSRSWLVSGILAGIMKISGLLGNGPSSYLSLIGILLAALSATTALCAFFWGNKQYGLGGGILSGIFLAIWIDAVYFGPRTLTDAISAHLLVIGLYLLSVNPLKKNAYRFIFAGFLLVISMLLRIQLTPAILFILGWFWFSTPSSKQKRPALFLGCLVALIFYGALDAFTWDYPFESVWRNLKINLQLGASHYFGLQPWFYYFDLLFLFWKETFLFLLLLAWLSLRDFPQILLGAALILFPLSFIAHKEWRFLYPAVLLFILSASLGLARLQNLLTKQWIERGFTAAIVQGGTCLALFLVMLLLSLYLVTSPSYQSLWTESADQLRASRTVAKLKGVCGIALEVPPLGTGGYSFMHQNVPLYWANIQSLRINTKKAQAFNTVISIDTLPWPVPGYRKIACFNQVCVQQRPGRCKGSLPAPQYHTPPMLKMVSQVRHRARLFNPA
ncbi:MAG TPA: hypothetical protein VLH77_01430 [Gammaproteobacteria bacterium]|nr:hypothetical protein [Gammaproteobacteria bacterium]